MTSEQMDGQQIRGIRFINKRARGGDKRRFGTQSHRDRPLLELVVMSRFIGDFIVGVRGTKSSAEIVSLKVNGMPPRLTAPSGLNAEERRMFTELVGDCHPRHFVKSDCHC